MDCPETKTVAPAGFDAFTFLTDPHDTLAEARANAPLFRDEATGHWVLTRYDTIKEVLSDPQTYSSVNAIDPITPLDSSLWLQRAT